MNSILKFIMERRKLFLSWLFSYLTIIIIALLISTVVYVQSIKVIESEINESHNAMLKQLQQTIDTKITDIEKIMYSIVLDQNVNTQSGLSEPIEPSYRLNMLNVVKMLGISRVTNSHISDIFICFSDRDLVVCGKGTSTIEQYFDMYYPNKKPFKGTWQNLMKETHAKEFYPMSIINNGKAEEDGAIYLQSIPYGHPGKSCVTLAIVLDNAFFQNALSSFKGTSNVNAMIVNSKNEVIATLNNSTAYKSIQNINLTGTQGIKDTKIAMSDVEVLYIKSAVQDWKYITVIPKAVFSKKAKDIQSIMIFCTILFLIGGIIAAVLFTIKNYNPIQNMIKTFTKTGKLKYDSRLNEFKLIENSFLSVIDENKNISKTLNQQKVTMKNNFLNRLVKGNIKDNLAIDDICSTYGIEFKDGSYMLILIYFEELGEMLKTDKAEDEGKAIELAQFIICNIIEELINEKHYCTIFEIDQTNACLINITKQYDNPIDVQEEIRDIVINAKEIIQEKYGILFSASISNIHATFSGIAETYRECLEAAEYKIVIGYNNIILFSDIHMPDSNSFINAYPIEVQQQFINCIKAGDFINAKQVMEQLFEKNFKNSNISLDMARCLMFAIINTMVNAINNINTIGDNKFFEDLDPLTKLIKCKTTYDMEKQMADILMEIEDYFGTKKKDTSSNKIMDIINYIDNHYFDCNLSVSSIAAEFNLNPVYLSRFFKEQTGEGVLHTINKIRIDRSKILLKDANKIIKDISEEVGFLNSTVFIRTFKKYEGITPGRFRESI